MILDTNALSAFADGAPELAPIVKSNAPVAIPVVVLGEYRYGIAHSSRSHRYRAWLEDFVPSCRVLSITEETSVWYAQVRSELRKTGKPIPSNDFWIAAPSRQHHLPVLSRDAHFDRVAGLRRVEW